MRAPFQRGRQARVWSAAAVVVVLLGWFWFGRAAPPVAHADAPRPDPIDSNRLATGKRAPDFVLQDVTTGQAIRLRRALGRPMVLMFGSATCPPFRSGVRLVEQIFERYRDKATFCVVYTREAHPRFSASRWICDPHTFEDRVRAASELREELALTMPMMVDPIDNRTGEQFAAIPSRLYVIDPEGRVAFQGDAPVNTFQMMDLQPVLDRVLAESATAKALPAVDPDEDVEGGPEGG